jgi:hypothetical protein
VKELETPPGHAACSGEFPRPIKSEMANKARVFTRDLHIEGDFAIRASSPARKL